VTTQLVLSAVHMWHETIMGRMNSDTNGDTNGNGVGPVQA